MYAIADSLAVEDITIKARQMVNERIEDVVEEKGKPRNLSVVEIYKMRVERTEFHLNNMIAMFNKACEQSSKETTENNKGYQEESHSNRIGIYSATKYSLHSDSPF